MLDIQLDNKSEQVMLFLLSQYDGVNAKGYSIYLPNDILDIEYAELKQICEYLSSINFINCHITHGMKQIKIFITREGIAYFERKKLVEQQLQEQKNIEQKKYTEDKHRSWIQFWIPLIVTSLISIISLIVAILKQ